MPARRQWRRESGAPSRRTSVYGVRKRRRRPGSAAAQTAAAATPPAAARSSASRFGVIASCLPFVHHERTPASAPRSCSTRAIFACTTIQRSLRPSCGPSASCRCSSSTTRSWPHLGRRTASPSCSMRSATSTHAFRPAAEGSSSVAGTSSARPSGSRSTSAPTWSTSSADVSSYAQQRERRLHTALAGLADRTRALPGGDRRSARRSRAVGQAIISVSSRPTGGAGARSRVGTCCRLRRASSFRRASTPARRQFSPTSRPIPLPLALPGRRRDRRAAAARRVARRRPRPLRGTRRRPRGRRDLAALAVPPLRLRLAAARSSRGHSSASGAEPFVRQLCWRDFNHQLLAARPETRARGHAPARRSPGATTTRRSRPGRRAAPATRSSTPACDSCCRRASCTTAHASSPARS